MSERSRQCRDLLVGMIAGIAMGIQQNFVLAPAHTHLNLVGGVLLFLFGLYYRMIRPQTEQRWPGFRAGFTFSAAFCFQPE
ncbi:hypothetical protein [Nitrobacter vulgaris]|uniref:hypothetical protein n=1 Tax=Nitrobacter vulgaris TaxID=29421 RepID=UPI00286BD897|nr:hypothetical protein [Nitrobacter vulgaris]